MRNGDTMDVAFSNGVLRSTKELDKISDNHYQINSFTDGWATADLTLDEAVKYCDGTITDYELNWY